MSFLTVGYAAGIIALGTVLLGFLLPTLIALLTASCLRDIRSAATWSVVGRDLQNTAWPIILRSDTTASTHVARPVRTLSWIRSVSIVLVALSGIITPLGLHMETRLDRSTTPMRFSKVPDVSPIGQGTPPRDKNSFYNRICHNNLVVGSCPFSSTQVNTTFVTEEGEERARLTNDTYMTYFNWNKTYDNRIPHLTAELFSSLHDDHSHTISGAFDIEWRSRSYSTPSSPGESYYHNKRYPIGSMRLLDSLILRDKVEAIEGLVVDTRTGGIGFRDHTAPIDAEIGAEWTEDLLFVSPESACVDTNLTLDFQIAPSGAGAISSPIVNVSITDRGGFTNIDRNYTGIDYVFPDPPRDAELRLRAEIGAWVNNGFSMLYLNVTNPHSARYKHAFEYFNSHIGKKFWLDADDSKIGSHIAHDRLHLLAEYGDFLPDEAFYSWNMSMNYTDRRARYQNPFGVDWDDFENARVMCTGAGDGDLANITNIAVSCGLMYGAAVPVDGVPSLVFEPGSWWRQPIYSCATASKASVKTAKLRWNATLEPEAGLARLQIELQDKEYLSRADEPFWAVENLHRQLRFMWPMWGMVSREMAQQMADNSQIDVVQSPHLYLPGLASSWFGLTSSYVSSNNIPVGEAFPMLLSSAYTIGDDLGFGTLYSGLTSMALFSKWQHLSSSPETAAKIPNLVWTDYAANALIGTRSQLSDNGLPRNIQPPLHDRLVKRSDSGAAKDRRPKETSCEIPVALYRTGIAYHWQFGIPAIITVALLLMLILTTTALLLVGRLVELESMQRLLRMTSAGRLLALIAAEIIEPTVQALETAEGDAEELEKRPTVKIASPYSLEGRRLLSDTKRWSNDVGGRPIIFDGPKPSETSSVKLSEQCTQSQDTQTTPKVPAVSQEPQRRQRAQQPHTRQPQQYRTTGTTRQGYAVVPQEQQRGDRPTTHPAQPWMSQPTYARYARIPQHVSEDWQDTAYSSNSQPGERMQWDSDMQSYRDRGI